ncbi:hypothetical protein GLAREA_11334 [Glarea lozoyensis ATCC 20868]|uniref:Uncharacterized protein n=1 Tax=Glarea lozoyensis (strain ATCC 20868 / MF5171) TaxID=1116229 RepID=S3DEU6_GLAL2|nr:uncharacterized protein GLAREA_11334 [Glarea lozoyensis ATCC 20868]EPE35634.1 hypothetical protein GLAREA_11334 [Glarea lozoyensis ATCC 20868]
MVLTSLMLTFLSLATATTTADTLGSSLLLRRDDTVETLSKLWDFKGCVDGEKQAIKDALTEANKILLSPGTSDIGSRWDDYSVVEFFGPPVMLVQFRELIKTNFWNARNFVDHWWSGNQVQIFCHTKPDAASCSNYPGFIKVERDGGTDDKLAMIFCSNWFELGTLDAVFSGSSTGPNKYDLAMYHNRALHWVGAMMQMPTINSRNAKNMRNNILKFPTANPEMNSREYVVGVERVKYLGKFYDNHLQRITILSNIDTWSWYAMAAYVQDKLGEYPHRPQVPSSLPSMQTGYVSLGNQTTDVDMPEDPVLVALEASLGE